MHMADALVAPVVAGVMYAASGSAAGFSIHKVRLENDAKKIPVMGVMGAFVFTAQMINFTIPGTGSSGHLCGGLLLSAILGPYAGFLSMIGVLLIQCLLFADGGLLALGCNVWNMAFYGCFVGALLIWRPMMRNGASKRKITAASIVGCVLTLQLGAFSVCLETLASGVTELPFLTFITVMQPIHLAIGLVEGLITAAVLCFVYEARPQLLWGVGGTYKEARFTTKKTIGIVAIAAAAVGGLLSLFASGLPDGLEWSMEQVAGTSELTSSGGIYAIAETIQNFTALLPDYAFRSSGTAAGTSFSGLIGAAVVCGVLVLACILMRTLRRRESGEVL